MKLFPPHSKPSHLVVMTVCYGVLAVYGWWTYQEVLSKKNLFKGDQSNIQFEGQDWIHWKSEEGKIIAQHVHPLLNYKSFPVEKVQRGDRLRKLNFQELYQATSLDEITRHAPAGKPFIYQLERTNPQSGGIEVVNIQVVNGFRLAFSFNTNPFLWRVSVWLAGLGSFIAIVVLFILVPFVQKNWKTYRPLMLVVISALLVFMLQLVHSLYLIIESDLVQIAFERWYTWIYAGLLLIYSICYVFFSTHKMLKWGIIPALTMLFGTDVCSLYGCLCS